MLFIFLASRAGGRAEQDSRTQCPALMMWYSPSPAWSTSRQNQHVSGVRESQDGVTNIPPVVGRSSAEQAGAVSTESVNLVAALHIKGLPINYLCSKACSQGCRAVQEAGEEALPCTSQRAGCLPSGAPSGEAPGPPSSWR